MSSYRVKTGHDQALNTLTVLDPQPEERHEGGIQYTQVTHGADGFVDAQGPFFAFHWSQIEAATYATILTAFGLSSAFYSLVTVYVRNAQMATWVRMNGIAKLPIPGDAVRWEDRPRDITITVTNLEAAS